ncbi:hypothetical protein SCP_0114500 [Sparassis crispa]|uniref:Uncharacterized protein n=1 Tax=Sparassis crispa TaxID=139825 RepID=A0A401G8R8_9APHY|nr:hypothetical protein SCP_0114500 [Sparassis crispa]GBE78561.1 hypothetical protein SCP_0114500 [Sparassis crispa]
MNDTPAARVGATFILLVSRVSGTLDHATSTVPRKRDDNDNALASRAGAFVLVLVI